MNRTKKVQKLTFDGDKKYRETLPHGIEHHEPELIPIAFI